MGFEETCDAVLQELLDSPNVRRSTLESVTKEQGLYVLWLDSPSKMCLKVGIAGPRRGKGVRGRLELHYSSHLSNSVLARHLAADSKSSWLAGRKLSVRENRQVFLANSCRFQVVAAPTLSRQDLLRLEAFLIRRLRPLYAGRVDPSKQPNKALQPTRRAPKKGRSKRRSRAARG